MSPMSGLNISYGIDDSDAEEAQPLPTPPHSENVRPPIAKKRGRPKGTTSIAVKGAKSKGRRASGGQKVVNIRVAAGKRKALKEISNSQTTTVADDIEEVDDFDALPESSAPTVQQVPTPTTEKKMPPKRGRKAKAAEIVKEDNESAQPGPKKRTHPYDAVPIEEIPETQQDPEVVTRLSRRAPEAATGWRQPGNLEAVVKTGVDEMEVDDVDDTDNLEIDPVVEPTQPATSRGKGKKSAVDDLRRLPTVNAKRSGSVSEAERGGNNSAMTRRLNDIMSKYEALQVKYHGLKQLIVEDGESNFDKLKKQADEKTTAANNLIASIRADLKAQKAKAAEVSTLQDRIAALESEKQTFANEAKSSKSLLTTTQAEIKLLQAKLAASRSASHPLENGPTKGPGSAMKSTMGNIRTMPGNAEAAKDAQKRALKEELYSDLTGLIVRDVVRREDEGDVYDLIQTGRNGTLHFHLTLSNTINNTENPHPTSYEDAEFTYSPFLDASRDKDLLMILPDYLTEEICFPRSNAAKFYSRIADCMTKKLIVEEDEGGDLGIDE